MSAEEHLRVLETAGIVHGVRAACESLFEFDPQPANQSEPDHFEQ
jgi:hypothetical protein